MDTESIAQSSLDKARQSVADELAKKGLKPDSQNTCIWFDDKERKKTYCVSFSITECDEYGGEG